MEKFAIKNQNASSGGNKKNLLKIAAVVICVISVLLIAFLASKNAVFFHLAQSKTLDGKYRAAATYVSESSDEKADVLSDYINLRVSINENYPNMLAEFDRNILNEWYTAVCNITENPEGLDEEIISKSEGIKQTLEMIFERLETYDALRPTILNVMDVFNEINRLYTKDVDGKNTAFSISGEYARIGVWEQQNQELMNFISATPNGESIYLFNFLTKEIEGECSDLKSTMNTVFESGYTAEDLVRFQGTAKKTFPNVQNGNVSLNVLDKETYEEYLYKGLCRSLVENLLIYYQ